MSKQFEAFAPGATHALMEGIKKAIDGVSVSDDAGVTMWESGQDYKVNQLVKRGNGIYICLKAHTSEVFDEDADAKYWGGVGGNHVTQLVKLGVTATKENPREVSCPLSSGTRAFKLSAPAVLKYKANEEGATRDTFTFTNGDASDFIFNSGYMVFDGTMHMRESLTITFGGATALGAGYVTLSDWVDLTGYKSVDGFSLGVYVTSDGVYGIKDGTLTKLADSWDALSDSGKQELFEGTDENATPTAEIFAQLGKFRVAKYSSVMDNDPITVTVVPNPQIVLPKGLIDTSSFETIKEITVSANVTGESVQKYAVTDDLTHYYTYNGGAWTALATETREVDGIEYTSPTAAAMAASGMTGDALAAVTSAAWAELTGNAEKIGVAYYFSKENATDANEASALNIDAEMMGTWLGAVQGVDWDYSYDNARNLTVYLYADGNYRINYDAITENGMVLPAVTSGDIILKIQGLYPTVEHMKEEHPEPKGGEAHLVGTSEYCEVYIWDEENEEWVNAGPIHGVKGDKGDRGYSAYEVAVQNGFSGTVSEWLESLKGEPGDGGGIELGDVKNATATAGTKQVTLKWTDPENLTYQDGTLARWAGTTIIRNEGSAPANMSYGTFVADITSKNAYASTGFVDSGLENGKTYYYRFFPHSTGGVYTAGTSVSATPMPEILTAPTVTSGAFTYTGSAQTLTFSGLDETKMEVTGTISETDAGDYKAYITPKDGYAWSGYVTTAKEYAWSIAKKTPTLILSTESVSVSNSSLTDTVSAMYNGDGTLSVSSGNTSIATATVSGNTITIKGVSGAKGSTTVNVTASAGTNYKAITKTIKIEMGLSYKKMTAVIDLTNSNPATCITYADDAKNMTAKSSAWDTFFGHYPVMLKNGVEGKKLNTSDFSKHADGTAADITSGDEGDVMVAFPVRGLTITTSADENTLTISMTDDPDDPAFKYYAHQRGDAKKNTFYLGAFHGFEQDSKLRSLSGKTPTTNKTIGAFRTLARANGAPNGGGGSGYDQWGFYQLTYLQCMYILKYKSLDSQTALGRGYVDMSSSDTTTATGGTNAKGMDYGETTGKLQMKLFGIEDFWGNVYDWIDGLYSDASYNILTATQGFNNTGSGYTNQGASGFSSYTYGYMKAPQGTTEKGFTLKVNNGSSSTYFADYAALYASDLPIFGGSWSFGSYAGAFRLYVYFSAAYASASIGARLMYV